MAYKYQNLAEVKAAFDSGELDRATVKLRLDNDCSSLVYCGPAPEGMSDEMQDQFFDEKYTEYSALYRGNGYSDLLDACEAAGIPAEWC